MIDFHKSVTAHFLHPPTKKKTPFLNFCWFFSYLYWAKLPFNQSDLAEVHHKLAFPHTCNYTVHYIYKYVNWCCMLLRIKSARRCQLMAKHQRQRRNIHSKLVMGEIYVSVPFAHKHTLQPSLKLTFLSQCFGMKWHRTQHHMDEFKHMNYSNHSRVEKWYGWSTGNPKFQFNEQLSAPATVGAWVWGWPDDGLELKGNWPHAIHWWEKVKWDLSCTERDADREVMLYLTTFIIYTYFRLLYGWFMVFVLRLRFWIACSSADKTSQVSCSATMRKTRITVGLTNPDKEMKSQLNGAQNWSGVIYIRNIWNNKHGFCTAARQACGIPPFDSSNCFLWIKLLASLFHFSYIVYPTSAKNIKVWKVWNHHYYLQCKSCKLIAQI